MNSLHNLPIHLRYEANGDVVAVCMLLPNCQCVARSRFHALRIMQQLIKDKFLPNAASQGTTYEIVYLGVSACADSENRFSLHAARHAGPESPLIEIL